MGTLTLLRSANNVSRIYAASAVSIIELAASAVIIGATSASVASSKANRSLPPLNRCAFASPYASAAATANLYLILLFFASI
jgi:hypothetical protein